MDLLEALEARHSVRSYTDKPLPQDVRDTLNAVLAECNHEGDLHMQLICDEPGAFGGMMAKYGSFSGVRNYLALVGKPANDLQERVGYYGERLVLLAQSLGLNSCWVALTFSKKKCAAQIEPGEKLVCVISLGFGTTQGKPRKTKPVERLCAIPEGRQMPDWFAAGMRAAQLAPTAMNQQKFLITLHEGNVVSAEATGGSYSGIDLGIVRCHFELGTQAVSCEWTWK